MATDLRTRIVALLDESDPAHDAVAAVRAVLDLHQPEPWHQGDTMPAAYHTICVDLGNDHPVYRCAGCSQLDEDNSGTTVAYPCRELALIAGALGVPVAGGGTDG